LFRGISYNHREHSADGEHEQKAGIEVGEPEPTTNVLLELEADAEQGMVPVEL
jgi:hypothetical protein